MSKHMCKNTSSEPGFRRLGRKVELLCNPISVYSSQCYFKRWPYQGKPVKKTILDLATVDQESTCIIRLTNQNPRLSSYTLEKFVCFLFYFVVFLYHFVGNMCRVEEHPNEKNYRNRKMPVLFCKFPSGIK